jgi:Flp pilus assembly protein TadG
MTPPAAVGAAAQDRAGSGPESGAVAVEFALGVGLLLLPVAILVLVLPTWVEHQSMARVAAQEAARTVALAGDHTAGVEAGTAAARAVAANHGLADSLAEIGFEGHLERGGTITASVTVTIPVVDLPLVGQSGGFNVTVRHREPVDQYRSFSPGSAKAPPDTD